LAPQDGRCRNGAAGERDSRHGGCDGRTWPQMDANISRTGSWLLPARVANAGRIQGCHRPL